MRARGVLVVMWDTRRKATSLACNLGHTAPPASLFPVTSTVCYLIKAIHQAVWDIQSVWERKRHVGKEIKVSEQTWSGWYPQIHFSLSIWLCVWLTDCQLRTTWSSDNCIHWHLVTEQKGKNNIKDLVVRSKFWTIIVCSSALTFRLIFFICCPIKILFTCAVFFILLERRCANLNLSDSYTFICFSMIANAWLSSSLTTHALVTGRRLF